MGTGKTTLLGRLAHMDLGFIMGRLGLNIREQPSILSISPRRDLARFTGEMLKLISYTDHERMLEHWYRWHGNDQAPADDDELLCAQRRLSICLNSLKRLRERNEGYDILIMDEFATTALSMISKHMLPYVKETMKILKFLVRNSKYVILLAADGTPRMARTLLPFVNWNDPANMKITVNNGGAGGISGHELYISHDLIETCRVLKRYVQEGKSVYVPTNYKAFAEKLVDFCIGYLGLMEDEVMIYRKETKREIKREIIRDPEWRLGHVDKPSHHKSRLDPYPKVRVFIATPAFGVGFSVKGDLFDVTIGFFFTYPLTVPGNVQHLARIRGVKEKTIICYYKSRQAKKAKFLRMPSDDQTRLENAIRTYENMIAGVDPERFEKMPDGGIRSFAIYCEVQARLSRWYGDSMFVEEVTKSTRTVPHLLESWICNKGVGPVKDLPELSPQEMTLIRSKDSQSDFANDLLPKTWQAMCELWLKQVRGGVDLTEDEARCIEVFDELPVPYGLLEEHERRAAFISRLDHIWRAMEVATAGRAERLLELDLKRYVASRGVSTVFAEERYYQQYQLFDVWARLLIPCLPEAYRQLAASESGIIVLSFLASQWQWKNKNDCFHFDLRPEDTDFEDALGDVEEMIDELCEHRADTGRWFGKTDLKNLTTFSENDLVKMYASVVRKGLRQFLGKDSVKVVTNRKNGSVRVKINGLKRLITLACVRRINLDCDAAIVVSAEKFSVVSKYRNCLFLTDLVPSDDELTHACGMIV